MKPGARDASVNLWPATAIVSDCSPRLPLLPVASRSRQREARRHSAPLFGRSWQVLAGPARIQPAAGRCPDSPPGWQTVAAGGSSGDPSKAPVHRPDARGKMPPGTIPHREVDSRRGEQRGIGPPVIARTAAPLAAHLPDLFPDPLPRLCHLIDVSAVDTHRHVQGIVVQEQLASRGFSRLFMSGTRGNARAARLSPPKRPQARTAAGVRALRRRQGRHLRRIQP